MQLSFQNLPTLTDNILIKNIGQTGKNNSINTSLDFKNISYDGVENFLLTLMNSINDQKQLPEPDDTDSTLPNFMTSGKINLSGNGHNFLEETLVSNNFPEQWLSQIDLFNTIGSALTIFQKNTDDMSLTAGEAKVGVSPEQKGAEKFQFMKFFENIEGESPRLDKLLHMQENKPGNISMIQDGDNAHQLFNEVGGSLQGKGDISTTATNFDGTLFTEVADKKSIGSGENIFNLNTLLEQTGIAGENVSNEKDPTQFTYGSQSVDALQGNFKFEAVPEKTMMLDKKIESQNSKFVISDKAVLGESNDFNKTEKKEGDNNKNDSGFTLSSTLSKGITEDAVARNETESFRSQIANDILNNIIEKTVVNFKDGKTSIKIKLEPEFLGPLRVQISTGNHQVMVKMETDVPWVKEVIEQNLNQLKSALHDQGLQIDQFDVSVATNLDHYGRDQRNPSLFFPGPNIVEDGSDGTFDEGIDALSAEGSRETLGCINIFI